MIAPHRRHVLGGLCSCSLLGLAGCISTPTEGPLTAGYRPPPSSDEGGIWYTVEKAEREVQRSHQRVRNVEWNRYLEDIVGRLSPEFRDDMRVYLLRTPHFNATMAPNGMMTVWTGLLLRVKDEAQLAAVLGHEIAHYTQRHSLARLRDYKARADFAVFLGLGLALTGSGSSIDVANYMLMAGHYAYTREHEREADEIGIQLMTRAGYRPLAASEVWQQLIEEREVDSGRRAPNLIFATHPAHAERMETLKAKAEKIGAVGQGHAARYHAKLRSIRFMLLEDELRLRQYERSLVLLRRLQSEMPDDGELVYFEGEVYRLRDGEDDRKRAAETYERAIAIGGHPPEVWRSLGQVRRKENQHDAARESFRKYLDLKPDADDRAIIASYLEAA